MTFHKINRTPVGPIMQFQKIIRIMKSAPPLSPVTPFTSFRASSERSEGSVALEIWRVPGRIRSTLSP